MRRAALLVLAALLAGCAGEPAPRPLESPPPVYRDGPPGAAPGFGLAPLEWRVLWGSDVAVSPATPVESRVAIPNGTVQVLVNLTTDAGAAYGFALDLGECHWRREVLALAQGQTWGADCGGLVEGESALFFTVTAGALAGRAEVAGILCDATLGRCPPRLPPTTS